MTIDIGRTIEDLRALIGVDSQNPGPQESACCAWVRERVEGLGIPAIVQPVENGRDNLVASVEGTGERPRLVLMAHLDTVPFGDGWSRAPLGGEVADGKIYGRGACDMKAGLAIGLNLLESVARGDVRPAGDVVLCATVDEEGAEMKGAHALVRDELLRPDDQVLALEPTSCRLRLAQVGVRWLRLTVYGRECHAGRAHLGIDANHVMARTIDRMKAAVASLPHDDPLLGPPRLTCGTLQGGIATNVVPGSSGAQLDLRLVPPMTPESALTFVDETVAGVVSEFDGARYELSALGASRPPVRASEESHIVRALRGAYSSTTGAALEMGGEDGHEAYTDASMVAALSGSESCTVFGPGSSDVAHTVDEFVPVADIERVSAVMDRLAATW